MELPGRGPRLLFLLGGSEALEAAAGSFVAAAGGPDATIVILAQSPEGWEKHGDEYTTPLLQRGASHIGVVVHGADGEVCPDQVGAVLRKATGILIGGGHTPTYQRLYATEPVRSALRQRYREGVPLAGMSAGALLCPEVCVLSPRRGGEVLEFAPGLGLLGGLLIGVHFSEREALPGLLEAMARTRTDAALGLDSSACAVFEDEQLAGVLGGVAHHVRMGDFATRVHTVTKYLQPYAGEQEPQP